MAETLVGAVLGVVMALEEARRVARKGYDISEPPLFEVSVEDNGAGDKTVCVSAGRGGFIG